MDAKKELAKYSVRNKSVYNNPKDPQFRTEYYPEDDKKQRFVSNVEFEESLKKSSFPERAIPRGAPDPEPPICKEILPSNKDFKKEFKPALNYIQIGNGNIFQTLPPNDGDKNVILREEDKSKRVTKTEFTTRFVPLKPSDPNPLGHV